MQEVLQNCLSEMEQGRSMEQCLALYPQEAARLEPLLQAALSARNQIPLAIPLAAQARLRNRVMGEWDRRQQPRRPWLRFSFMAPRWVAVAASIVLVVALSSVSTVAAAGGAVPGDFLYPVKELREEAQLWFAWSSEAKVEMYTRLVKERAQEVRDLASPEKDRSEKDRSGAISQALDRLDKHLAALDAVVQEKLRRGQAAPEMDPDFLEALSRVIEEQQSVSITLNESLAQAPPDARSDLGDSLKAIQQAQERVRAALEAALPSGSRDGP
ncbi:MAG: hypothetical protein BZY88_18575 [SAR202 cluster bacterium Io17-Chloro-G9]|nr:MAG: hypothetical protein BZY88_18575 [SAR202 cluster bacterium Io17-Chloro-G9]